MIGEDLKSYFSGLDLNRDCGYRHATENISVGPGMNDGKLVIAPFLQHIPLAIFRRGVARYPGNRKDKIMLQTRPIFFAWLFLK
ncbi:hypothetical protein N8198_07825 [Gammaproteobacteria bacterium]|nr:hypothetical protein [Gammaproteobacteria bacterium]